MLTVVVGAYADLEPVPAANGHGRPDRGGQLPLDRPTLVILLGTLFAIALAIDDNEREGMPVAESHVLVLFASSGMMLLAAAQDLMIVFLGIELMSLVRVLAGRHQPAQRARRPRARSSTSCSARSPRRSCCTAWRSIYGATGHHESRRYRRAGYGASGSRSSPCC